nr:replication-associated recombination protein A [Brevibacterium album]
MSQDPLSLFEPDDAARPLADRLRPTALEDVVGQEHLLGQDGPLGRMVAEQRLVSMILWGPPGCGKTTIARLLAERTNLVFEPLSATFSGVADLRKVFVSAQKRREIGQGTLLFVDEIHRFNRAQQDSFLPYVEDGTIVLVGATTENPSFELNGALHSRCQVFVLKRLDEHALTTLIERAEHTIGRNLPLDADARQALVAMADGDGRYLLNLAEQVQTVCEPLDAAGLAQLVQQRAPLYDKSQEGHYNLVSALHKSMRGSDPDAALYWLARMLDGAKTLSTSPAASSGSRTRTSPSPTPRLCTRRWRHGTCMSASAPRKGSSRSRGPSSIWRPHRSRSACTGDSVRPGSSRSRLVRSCRRPIS